MTENGVSLIGLLFSEGHHFFGKLDLFKVETERSKVEFTTTVVSGFPLLGWIGIRSESCSGLRIQIG